MKGIFITFEGIDGVGKSSILQAIYSWLQEKKQNKKVLLAQEPTCSFMGDFAKELVFEYKNLPLDYQSYLFLADRIYHLQKKIIPALKQGKIVLCDRYHDSTIAYQGEKKGKKEFFFAMYNNFIMKPDLTLLFDAKLDICQERLKKRKKKNTFDEKDALEYIQTKENYFWLQKKEKNRIFLIENNTKIENAVNLAKEIITKKIF